ncbi:uncharacterized protein [Rutidosis leptorrhynchoides]|uniref:uncharacterized protein n=1 Tax=Rutidosis leptorrhynchoides TaxID=125765 RepID=UPI003A992705
MSDNTKIHPAFTVSNIKDHVPITLELNTPHYNTWSELFKITCTAYGVLDHLTPSTDSESSSTITSDNIADQAVWVRLNALVLSWIHGTVSLDLLNTIFQAGSSAAATWLRIKNIFQDNRSSRALYLQHQFNNIKLDSFTDVSSYCQEIKSIADQLANVDDKVSDERMVLQLIAGLNESFDFIRSQLAHINPLPTFYQARSMLLLEETRKGKQHESTIHVSPPDAALISTATPNTHAKPPTTAAPNFTQPQPYHGNNYRGRGNNRGNYRGCSGTRGRGNRNYQNNQANTWATPPSWAYPQQPHWAYYPPCPYPTTSWTRPPSTQAGLLGPRPTAQAHSVASGSTGYCLRTLKVLYTL